MKRMLLSSLGLVAIGMLAAPVAAQYKWRTPEGTTVYSDVPPPSGARLMNDRSEASDERPADTAGRSSEASDRSFISLAPDGGGTSL